MLREKFGVRLKIFDNMCLLDEQEEAEVAKVAALIDRLDHVALNALFQVTICSKSSAVALALIHGGHITVEDAVRFARIDEDFQTKYFGVVQGAHDLDEAYLYSVFSTASTLVDLSMLRDF